MTATTQTIERPGIDADLADLRARLDRLAEGERRLEALYAEHDRILAECLEMARAPIGRMEGAR